jgi:hypothetical protein
MGCLTSWILFVCNEPFLLAHYPTKKNTSKGPQNEIFFWKMEWTPLVHLYRWKDDHFGQNKCGAIRNIWENTLRTWGPCENLKGIDWEQEKVKKIQRPHPHTPSPKDKTLGYLNACSIASLSWQKFYFYICLSPFSNNWGGLFMLLFICMGDSWVCFDFVFFISRSHVVLPFGPSPFTVYIHGSWNIAK